MVNNIEGYILGCKVNPDWITKPEDQWGIVEGETNDCKVLPFTLIQRKKVPSYVQGQAARFEPDAVYFVAFTPADSYQEAQQIEAARVNELNQGNCLGDYYEDDDYSGLIGDRD